jgi:hypothetical protein
LGTHWELEGNKGKMKKKNPPPAPHPKLLKIKQNQGTLSAC